MKSISRTPSIYQIRHIESGRVYVGSAINPYRRCKDHRSLLSRGMHSSPYLQHTWDKYGESAFVFEIIEPVLFVEDLIAREQFWIDSLRASDPAHGFNIAPTAGSLLGRVATDETRAKLSARAKAQFATPEARAKLSADSTTLYSDPLQRQRSSDARRAWFTDPEKRAEVAARTKAQWDADPERRAKLSASAKNRQSDPEVRARLSARAKALWEDPEYRARQQKQRDERKKGS